MTKECLILCHVRMYKCIHSLYIHMYIMFNMQQNEHILYQGKKCLLNLNPPVLIWLFQSFVWAAGVLEEGTECNWKAGLTIMKQTIETVCLLLFMLTSTHKFYTFFLMHRLGHSFKDNNLIESLHNFARTMRLTVDKSSGKPLVINKTMKTKRRVSSNINTLRLHSSWANFIHSHLL